MRSPQNRKGAELDFARETRGSNLRGIPSPESERLRRAGVPTTSLVTSSTPGLGQRFSVLGKRPRLHYATAQRGAVGRRGCEILLPLSFRWQQRKNQRSSPADGASTSLLHPPLPALQPPVALPIFSRSSAVGSRFIELTD